MRPNRQRADESEILPTRRIIAEGTRFSDFRRNQRNEPPAATAPSERTKADRRPGRPIAGVITAARRRRRRSTPPVRAPHRAYRELEAISKVSRNDLDF